MVLPRVLGLIGMLAIAATPSVALGADGDDKEAATRKICKTQEKTGTRFTARTCRTPKEWDELAEQARRAGKEMIDNASAQAQVRQNGPG